MAIKIDLLPGYVKLRRDFHRSVVGCVVATCVVVGGLLLILQKRQLELKTAKQNLEVIKLVADKATAAQTSATNIANASAPNEGAIAFMVASTRTGPQRAALLDLVRQYIAETATVSSIDISDGQNVIIKATVKTPDDYAAFLLNLRRAADINGGVLFKGLPSASGPGGFANGAVPFQQPEASGPEGVPIIYPINVTAQGALLNPIQVPPDPTGGAVAPGGSVPGSSPSLPPSGPSPIPSPTASR